MKTIKFIGALASLVVAGGTYAQTTYDAARLTDSDLNGTARFVGMGGAMGALGGDITTMATNPAGIGIFRSSDANATIGLMGSKMGGETKSIPTFDSFGFVISSKYGERTSLKYINFGVNYRRKKDFNTNLGVDYGFGDLTAQNGEQMSQTYIMKKNIPASATLDDADVFFKEFPNNVPSGNAFNGAPSMAQLGVLGMLTYDPSWNSFDYTPANSARYYSERTGGIDEFDFNVAFNVNNQFYFGATVGAYNVNYNMMSTYSELSTFDNQDYKYTLTNWQKTTGVGFDLKLGMILRPVESSPFRIGVAVHTPTWYNLTNTYNVNLFSEYVTSDLNNINLSEMSWDYQLMSPWKFNVSLGHTVGTTLALGAEYEYQDYSSCKFADENGDDYSYDYENQYISEDLKGVHTLRLGLEAKLVPEFCLRAGYNYSTAQMQKGAYNSVDGYHYTETAFMNGMDKNTFTLGMGYRGQNLYADLAYQYSTQKNDFYAFDDSDLKAKSITQDRNKFMLTIGYKF